MPMATAEKVWTLEELHSLPDDGNKYELVHGVLFVTPPPNPEHEEIATRLTQLLEPYVSAQRLGAIYHPRSVVRFRGSEVEPDLIVRKPVRRGDGWEQAPLPSLVVEVLSPSTRRRDHSEKKAFYAEVTIPEYWIVDPESRTITVIRPDHEDAVERVTVVWEPPGASASFTLKVMQLFE